jgi:hypothetical protein
MATSYPESPIPADRICSMDDIIAENRRSGFHWFSTDTMRFFGTRLNRSLLFKGPGGVYFVTSEWTGFNRDRRGYTVRQFDLTTGGVNTVQFDGQGVASLTRSRAATLARNCAAHGRPGRDEEKR